MICFGSYKGQYPGDLVCQARISSQNDMGSYSILVLQSTCASAGAVTELVTALCCNLGPLLRRQALLVLSPSGQQLIKGHVPYHAGCWVSDVFGDLQSRSRLSS